MGNLTITDEWQSQIPDQTLTLSIKPACHSIKYSTVFINQKAIP